MRGHRQDKKGNAKDVAVNLTGTLMKKLGGYNQDVNYWL